MVNFILEVEKVGNELASLNFYSPNLNLNLRYFVNYCLYFKYSLMVNNYDWNIAAFVKNEIVM